MRFPWNKYKELPLERRNTLQVFITNRCNMKCDGCFARKVMKDNIPDMSIEEYEKVVSDFLSKGGKQINILGGEPLLHKKLGDFLDINRKFNIKTTVYTNGTLLDKYNKFYFYGVKLRVSIYSGGLCNKGINSLPDTDIPFDANFMVSSKTTVDEMLYCAYYVEEHFNSDVFFIYSMRELDNQRMEFFDDTEKTMSVINYKELVHKFLQLYDGNLMIDVSKRGVFESTTTLPDNKCRFSNYFIGGKIIQCPYDVVNLKYQNNYQFGQRYCQQNNTCLMSKIKLERI